MLHQRILLPALHSIISFLFKKRGYQWETRRNGEVQLGLWKKSFRKKPLKKAYPKRFVLLPGLGDTPLSWYAVLVALTPILKSKYDEIVLVDFPGFSGFLSRERAIPSMDMMLSTLHDRLDSLKPDTLLGHSLGGWLAAHYAAQCGEGNRPKTNRLNYNGPALVILANPAGVFLNEIIKEEWTKKFTLTVQEGFAKIRPHLFKKEPLWFPLIVPQMNHFYTRDDVLQFLKSFKEEHAVQSIMHHIKAQVWLIWGEDDTLMPASCVHDWLTALKCNDQTIRSEKHQAVLLKNTGHSPQIENPAITAAVLGQILENKIPHEFGKRWYKVVKGEIISPTPM